MIGADAVRGHIDLIVLAILEEAPSYAYDISRTISKESGGAYIVKQTTLYTAVKRLETQGALTANTETSDSGKPRTYYTLTPDGKELLEAKRAEWQQTKNLVDHFTTPSTHTSKEAPHENP
ncbi:MAG: PadR family transcriptional regulator [Rothia sp. (in: high G+C Gram-positive bacteria)]|nr:PadR family transcriptional regulator [Rothia sp. (in: high G+C Gram-positive bacteria)]